MNQFDFKTFALLFPTAIVMPAYSADYLTEAQAQKILFPAADSFVKKSVTLSDEMLSKIKSLSGVKQRNKSPQIWRALKKDKLLGMFLIDEVIGKHEYITYAVGLSPEGSVLGVEILSYRETHGGEIKSADWRKNFAGKKISDPFKLNVDVPNITGATLSCRNVLDGVKRLLALQQVVGND